MTFDADGEIEPTDTAEVRPGARHRPTPADPDYAAEDATLKAAITDPLVAYKATWRRT